MMTKYFIDKDNNYVGGYSGALPPDGSIEVPFPPEDARQKWDGKKWLPYVEIPKQVTMAQARLALYDEGLLSLVDETISLMPIQEQREKAKIQWEFETTVNRNSALVYGLAGGLGLTDEMLDDLFIKASKI